MPSRNPYERQRRTLKALKVAEHLDAGIGHDHADVLDRLETAPDDFLETVSRVAGVRRISRTTWEEAIDYLRDRRAYDLTQAAERARV